MKRYCWLCSGLLLGLLSSCASKVSSIHYYSLTEPQLWQSFSAQAVNNKQPLLLIEPVNLADFLTTGGLVMQTQAHELQLSAVHRWAENLPQAINQNLLLKLSSQLPMLHVEQAGAPWLHQPHIVVQLSFTDFEVSAEHETITAGQFWIFNAAHDLITKQAFFINLPVTQDGYTAVVSQLDHSLSLLSEQIAKKLPVM